MCCNQNGCKNCFFYDNKNIRCMRRNLSRIALEIAESYELSQYFLKLSIRYKNLKKLYDETESFSVLGMIEFIESMFESLGISYLLN